MLRVFFAALAVAMLVGCATAPPNPINADMRDSVFVSKVSVTWSDEMQKRFAKRMDDKAFADVQPRLEKAVTDEFKNSPSGAHAIDFKIEVNRYLPTLSLRADVTVVRESDGQVLAVYKNVEGYHPQGGGLVGAVIEAALKTDYLGIIDHSFAERLKDRFDD